MSQVSEAASLTFGDFLFSADSALRPSPRNPKFIVPIEEEGIKMLSFGHVSAKAGVPGAGGKVRQCCGQAYTY